MKKHNKHNLVGNTFIISSKVTDALGKSYWSGYCSSKLNIFLIKKSSLEFLDEHRRLTKKQVQQS